MLMLDTWMLSSNLDLINYTKMEFLTFICFYRVLNFVFFSFSFCCFGGCLLSFYVLVSLLLFKLSKLFPSNELRMKAQ